MADSLGEIYRNSVAPSNLSNGEATLVTTNSSTSHVIRDVQYVEGDSDLPMGGELEINGYKIADAKTTTGTAIMGPSSTLKYKTNFTLDYKDIKLSGQTSSSTLTVRTIPSVNNLTDKSSVINSTESVSGKYQVTTDDAFRQIHRNVGGTSNHVVWSHDNNSNQILRVGNGTSALYNETSGYRAKWFDGERYAYFHNGWNISRVDCWSSSPNAISISGTAPYYENQSTYPKAFGIKDKWFFWWTQYNATSVPPYAYNIQTDTFYNLSASGNQAVNSVFPNAQYYNFYALERTDGKIIFVSTDSNSYCRYYEWSVGDKFPNSTQGTQLNLTNSWSGGSSVSGAAIGDSLYYSSNNDRTITKLRFTTAGPVETNLGFSLYSTSGTYGDDVWGTPITPSASTISGRTYNISPSASFRITGVTST